MGIKRALSVGINYPDQPHYLRGCVNDSLTIDKMLREKFGFEDVTLLLDNDATTQRIKEELVKLINGSKPGDVLFFHYSGHGTQIIDDKDPDVEPDGLDEVICPVDFNWRDKVIRDDDLKAIFDCVPAGVNMTVFLDCCNSGGGVDAANEYQAETDSAETGGEGRFLKPSAEMQAKMDAAKLDVKPRITSRKVDRTLMLISGARAHQTAADARINGVYQGATTYTLQRALEDLGVNASYKQIVDRLNEYMVEYGFTQRPQLDGPESLHDRSFLSEYDFGDPNAVAHHTLEDVAPDEPKPDVGDDVTVDRPTSNVTIDSSTTVNIGNDDPVAPPPAPKPAKKKDDKDDDKKKKTMMIVGAVALIGLAIAVFAL